MTQAYRSRRTRLAALVKEQRAAGQSWAQIARRIAGQEHVNTRVAMRLAHGLTQTDVARLWNELWPPGADSAGLCDKNISYWETWPQTGHEPSLRTLKRLAQLYQCDVGDLIDDGSYSHLDTAKGRPAQSDTKLTGQASSAGPARPAGPAVAATRAQAQVRLPGELAPLALAAGQQPGAEHAARLLAPLQPLVQLAEQQHQGDSPLGREALYYELVRSLASWAGTMKRRELLSVLAWAATTAAATPLFPGLNLDEQERVVGVLDGRHRVDEQVIGHIESVLWSAQRQDDALGPQAALDTLLAQRNLVRTMLPDCPAALRPRLLSLFANMSRYVGWLCYDLGDFDSATYFYEQARIAAHEAENTELGISTLCNLSHMATWRGQPRVGIDHAVAAAAWAKQTGDRLLSAYVADVSARAYARAGNQRACLDALDSIPPMLDGAGEQTPATSLAYFYGPGGYASSRAWSLLLLHDNHGALAAAHQAVTLIGPSFVRNKAFSMLHLGNAYVQSQEIDEAARMICAAAGLAARNRSARLMTSLMQSRRALDPWDDTAAVRDLDEQLVAHGWDASSTR